MKCISMEMKDVTGIEDAKGVLVTVHNTGEQKQGRLRSNKLGQGTVLIFYKSFAPTSIYM